MYKSEKVQRCKYLKMDTKMNGHFWMGGIKVINWCTNQYLNKMEK